MHLDNSEYQHDLQNEPHSSRPQHLSVRSNKVARLHVGSIFLKTMAIIIATCLVAGAAYAWQANRNLKRSGVLSQLTGRGKSTPTGEMNILLMGLDSRLDVNGKPLSTEIYNQLHTGDSSSGGLNSNVLMYMHIPAGGSKATVISIPRDDYVQLPGCPDGECQAKIKEAYGLAVDQKTREMGGSDSETSAADYQTIRDAGRKEEIATVEQFLGVKINHFVEVTMVAFFQIAQVVQPITVCLANDTRDSFSGANFKAGLQQIDASQALAFVRQRRDTQNESLEFTDLDRARRQQAFIASLYTQLKKTNLLNNPGKLNQLIDVAHQNMVIDDGLSISELLRVAKVLKGSTLSFYTLPIKGFGTSSTGQSINLVDTKAIQATVASLLADSSGKKNTEQAISHTFGKGTTIDAVNASGKDLEANKLITGLQNYGFSEGQATTATQTTKSTTIRYASGSKTVAKTLSKLLGGVPIKVDQNLNSGEISVTIGTAFDNFPASTDSDSETKTDLTPVPADSGGVGGPAPTQLTTLSGSGIPCVK